MKHLDINQKDIFQEQLKNFKALLIGSKMAEVSAILLMLFSIGAAYYCRNNIVDLTIVLLGAILQLVFIVKYLQLTDVKQKSYTLMSLQSSVSKFKDYISNRKKYEFIIMAFYLFTLIPFALRFESLTFVIIVFVLAIIFMTTFGMLAFKKVDSNITLLETTLKN